MCSWGVSGGGRTRTRRIGGETAQLQEQFLSIVSSFPRQTCRTLLNPSPQPLKLIAKLLCGMFKFELFGQANRQDDNVDVMLLLSLFDDPSSRVFQEVVEVSEEAAVVGT